MKYKKTDHMIIRSLQRGITKKEIKELLRYGKHTQTSKGFIKVSWKDIIVIMNQAGELITIYRDDKKNVEQDVYNEQEIYQEANKFISLDLYKQLLDFKRNNVLTDSDNGLNEDEISYEEYMSLGKKKIS